MIFHSFGSYFYQSNSKSYKCEVKLYSGLVCWYLGMIHVGLHGAVLAQASVDRATQHSPLVRRSRSDLFSCMLSSKLRSIDKA